ncbi:MAG: type II secretion system protein GspF [Desulfobacteraceae bacterium]|nr:type II secretion system protein GspF [Desulfobacteraceae bacterium]MBU4054284.1 type II secretion system inner membrane protein GspF [Pseudomonadota bacterium]
MPVFEYSALDPHGKSLKGIMDAESALAARRKIRNTGKFPVTIRELEESTSKQPGKGFSLPRLFRRVKPAETAIITRQLSTLLSAGLPLVTALDTIVPQMKAHAFKTILAQIKDAIVEGSSFADALADYPETFSPLYYNMVKAGESSGTLEIVLARLADITEKQQALNSRIQAAMIYPIFMGFIGFAVLAFLMTVVVPQITSIFEDMNQALPTPTVVLISISSFIKSYWWALFLLGILLFILFRRFRRTEKGRYYWNKAQLGFPLAGNLAKKLAISRFSRTLGSLLANGVPMMNALAIVKNISPNVLISKAVENAAEDVGKGRGLAQSLGESNIFPNLPVQMIQIGEQSGELESMLGKIADIYESDVEISILKLTSLLEPLIILVMAVMVGFIVISICLPIIEMNQLVL